MCTDGLANIGLGGLDAIGDENTHLGFYNRVCDFAKEKGIVINVITIKGEGCKMDVLG